MLRRIFCRAALIGVAVCAVLALTSVLFGQGRSDDGLARAIEAQEKHTERLMELSGVEGTAVGLDEYDRLAVKVFTDGPGVAGIPKVLDGVPVRVVVTGKFYALSPGGQPAKPEKRPSPQPSIDPTSRFARPVPIGVSTGNEGECSAGTIGCRVKDASGNLYALSNNHVYALENHALFPSDVFQPGRYDTGCSTDADNFLGALAAFEPIVFSASATNTVDAAIAASDDLLLGNATPTNGYGTPKSTTLSARPGQKVQKYGRTTSLTKGQVSDINATILIGYSSGMARFVGQIVVYSSRGPFIKSGDSGSLLVTDPDKNPVGLLFAGDSSGKYGIANQIGPVLTAFGVTIDGE